MRWIIRKAKAGVNLSGSVRISVSVSVSGLHVHLCYCQCRSLDLFMSAFVSMFPFVFIARYLCFHLCIWFTKTVITNKNVFFPWVNRMSNNNLKNRIQKIVTEYLKIGKRMARWVACIPINYWNINISSKFEQLFKLL